MKIWYNRRRRSSRCILLRKCEKSLSSYSSGKLPRIDGVTYEDIKANRVEYGNDILKIFNVILMNRKLPNT